MACISNINNEYQREQLLLQMLELAEDMGLVITREIMKTDKT